MVIDGPHTFHTHAWVVTWLWYLLPEREGEGLAQRPWERNETNERKNERPAR